MKQELGWYAVNNIRFTNKILAILEAQKTKADIEWHFHDNVFKKASWKIEPNESLAELYKKRALQIREKYDYVILMCSGGADSTNMLYSFLHNGIKVDEVIAEIPMSGLSNWQWNTTDTSAVNTASEYKFAQLPLMHEIATKYPDIKTTILDPFEKMFNPKGDDWLLDCQDIINPYTGHRGRMDDLHYIKNMAESGKRIAVVMGTDKPILAEVDTPDGKRVISIFSDMPINLPKQATREGHDNVDRVLFYWTHEMPELVVKMSHVAARAVYSKENSHLYRAMLDMKKNNTVPENVEYSKDIMLDKIINSYDRNYNPSNEKKYNAFSVYERGIVPYIYPTTYNPNLWQADKMNTGQTFLSDNQDWFRILHSGTKAMQIIESDFKHLYNLIDPKYMNNKKTGFMRFLKAYIIGEPNNFKEKE